MLFMHDLPAIHSFYIAKLTRDRYPMSATRGPTSPHDGSGDSGSNGGIRYGQPGYRRAVLALFATGLASFNTIYCTQALMPALSEYFGATPAMSAWTVSAATGMLALAILPASILSERYGRSRVIAISTLLAVTVGGLLPLAPSIEWLIVGRAFQGLAIAGVPATAMAWLADEISGLDLPRAMGQYIAGTTLGGLLSRLIPAGVMEFANWRWGLAATMVVAGACAITAVTLMPSQTRFAPKSLTLSGETRAIMGHLRNPPLFGLFAIAFLLMGAFVSLYDYLGYRLIEVFDFSPGLAGSIFLLYLIGTMTSGWAGAVATRHGRPRVLAAGIGACLIALPLIAVPAIATTIIGTALFTGGFFIAHSIASGWVGALAERDRAEATGTYLTAYYLGSSLLGVVSGLVMHELGWGAMIAFLSLLTTLSGLAGMLVARYAKGTINN